MDKPPQRNEAKIINQVSGSFGKKVDCQTSTENRVTGSPTNVIQTGTLNGDLIIESGVRIAPTPRQLPNRTSDFVGRQYFRQKIDDANQQSRNGSRPQVIVVSGPPGVGKTSVVLEWAYEHRREFPDGELFINLHGFDIVRPMSCEEVFDGFLRALGVPAAELPGTLDSQRSLFATIMADRRMLVLLDNTDHAELIRPFIVGSPSTTLITSRNQLPGLSVTNGARRLRLGPLDPDESIELLGRIAGEQRIAAESEAARELASRCAHLPLALRIAAEQLATNAASSIGDHLQELKTEQGLDALNIDGDGRTELRTVFSWSYRALDSVTASTFRLAGIHPGRTIGLAAVSALTGLDQQKAKRVMRRIAGFSLILEGVGGRYQFYDLLREYACELMRSVEGVETQNAATRRLIGWYLATARNADLLLTPGFSDQRAVDSLESEGQSFHSYGEALGWLEEERPNLVDIIKRAFEVGEYSAAARLPYLLWSFFNTTKCWHDWILCNEIGIDAARRGDDSKTEAYLLTSLGVAYFNLKQLDDSIDRHQQAIVLFQQAGEVTGLAYAKQNLANSLTATRRFPEALSQYEEALTMFGTLSDPRRGRAVTLTSMSYALTALKSYERALVAAEESHQLMVLIDDEHGAAAALSNAGFAQLGLGCLDEARRKFELSLSLRRRVNDRYGEARSLLGLGQALAENGLISEAERTWNEALHIYTEIQAPQRSEVVERLAALYRHESNQGRGQDA